MNENWKGPNAKDYKREKMMEEMRSSNERSKHNHCENATRSVKKTDWWPNEIST